MDLINNVNPIYRLNQFANSPIFGRYQSNITPEEGLGAMILYKGCSKPKEIGLSGRGARRVHPRRMEELVNPISTIYLLGQMCYFSICLLLCEHHETENMS